jgi:hypothetical protein
MVWKKCICDNGKRCDYELEPVEERKEKFGRKKVHIAIHRFENDKYWGSVIQQGTSGVEVRAMRREDGETHRIALPFAWLGTRGDRDFDKHMENIICGLDRYFSNADEMSRTKAKRRK